MKNDPTTARARRQQAVDQGTAPDAVDTLSGGTDPRSQGRQTPTRRAQTRAKREVADEIDIDSEGVGSVDRIEEGLDVFLRTSGVDAFGDNVAQDFAAEADFVTANDIDPNVDGEAISAAPVVAAARRDDVADRARQQTAADAQFIQAADLSADVGDRGVTGIEVAADRRDDVAARTRSQLAADDPFANASDFGVTVGATGVTDAGLTDDGKRRRAGRQFTAETPLDSVDPFADITETDSGFGLGDAAQKRSAARGFEDDLSFFEQGSLTGDDIRDISGGFGLAREPARELAAEQIDQQVDEFNVGVDDITLTETDSGRFEGSFEREVSR